MTRPRALLGGIMVAAILLFLAVPARIEAHAAYVRSDPPADAVLRVAPARVTVWFSEPLAVALSRIEVRDTTNARVDNGDSTGDPADPMRLSVGVRPLANGTYTVVWNNVSTLDGHPLRGSFVFHVGDSPMVETTSTTAPAALASPIDPWIRWIALLAAVAATGGLLFEAAVLRPAVQHTHSREPVRVAVTEIHRVLSRGRVAASAVFLGSALLQVVAQASVVAGVAVWTLAPADVIDVVRYTGWGQFWLARVLLALLAVVAPLLARRLPRASEAWLTEVVPFLATLAALSTFSLSSHGAATADLAFPGALTDYVHLLAAAVWVGGLLALLPTLVLLRRLLPADDRRPLLASIAERFTTIAAPAVGVVLLTGVYSGWLQLRSFEAVTTPYGLALAAKTTLVGVLLLLGAANLLWVRPLLARAERAAAASAWLHRFVAAEVAAAILVMLAVGLITSLEPARQVQERITGGGLHASQEAAGTRIDVTVQPGTPGLNHVLLTITDRRGQRVTNATAIVVRPRYLDADLGATEVNTTPTPDGRYEVQRVPLSIAGAWEVQVTVTRPGAGDATVTPRFAVSATPPPPRTDAELGRTLWSWLVLGVGLVVLVLAPRAWSGRIARSRMRILATTVVMIGVVLVYGAHSHGGPQQQQATGTNPVPGGPQAVEVGRLLYQQQCASCHGISGLGDGPQAAGLQPPPADLRLHTPMHPDSQIYAFISQGFPGSAMPAFTGRLTETQMWNLVHYLRALTTPTTQ
ncbi:MAG: copper resistance protein CopC [Dehalococcoidia bacterium]